MIKNQWYAVLASKEVKKEKLLAVRRLGLDLVFFRDQEGKPACLMDQCSHRGAALSKGKVLDSCQVQCPFHGLEFDAKGACNFIPALGKAQQENLGRFNVQAFETYEKAGIIYLWYGDQEAQGTPAFFPDQVDETYVYSEFKDPWKSHYSRSIENQLDVVHLPFVHHNTIGRGNKTLVNGPKVLFDEEPPYVLTSANNEVDQGQKPKGPQDCQIRSTYLHFKFPNLWMNHITDKIKVVIFFAPVDEETTILYLRFYNNITGFKPLDRVIASLGSLANKVIERQDKRVVQTQRPKASSLKSKENLIPGDRPIIQYRKIRDKLQKQGEKDQDKTQE